MPQSGCDYKLQGETLCELCTISHAPSLHRSQYFLLECKCLSGLTVGDSGKEGEGGSEEKEKGGSDKIEEGERV